MKAGRRIPQDGIEEQRRYDNECPPPQLASSYAVLPYEAVQNVIEKQNGDPPLRWIAGKKKIRHLAEDGQKAFAAHPPLSTKVVRRSDACCANSFVRASAKAGYRAWRTLARLTVAGQRRTGSQERHRSSPIVRRASGRWAHLSRVEYNCSGQYILRRLILSTRERLAGQPQNWGTIPNSPETKEPSLPSQQPATDHNPQSTIHSPLSAIHYPLSTAHCPLPTIHCPLPTAH